jgi:hypothetical protein
LEGIDFLPDQKKVISKCIHDIHNLIKASNSGVIACCNLPHQIRPFISHRIQQIRNGITSHVLFWNLQ